MAHAIGELQLRSMTGEITERKYKAELKKLESHELFYESMPEEVSAYSDFVMGLLNEYQKDDPLAELYTEQTLSFTTYVPEGFGTGDAVIVSYDTIHVIDLKFGRGVRVDPYENPQLKLYALGALEAFGFMNDISRIRVSIAQVRLNAFETFETDTTALLEWAEQIKPIAKQAYEGTGAFKAGDWCTFCKFGKRCKARAEAMAEVYEGKYQRDTALTDDEIAKLLPMLDGLKKWASSIQDGALSEILDGGSIPGWKAVAGRANRVISDEEGLAQTLLKDFTEEGIYKPKSLKSLTELERLAGKKYFAEISKAYITRPEGRPTLVPEADKRTAINDIANDFEYDS